MNKLLASGGILCGGRKEFEKTQPLLSLVIPMFNERDGLKPLFETIHAVMAEMPVQYEIVCVDDGCTDGTFECLKEFNSSVIRAYKLSRNFGKEVALSAGLDVAKGDIVIPMDADLQEPPALIPEMYAKWCEGYDVVHAIRRSRAVDGKMKAGSAKMFYKLFNLVSVPKIPEDVGDFRLMDRRVVDVLKKMPERNRFMKGLLSWPGFRSTHVEFDRPDRCAGETKWKPHRLVGLAIDGFTSFSIVPLRVASFLGAMFSSLAFLFGAFVVFKRLFYGDPVQGYASLMAIITFLGGLQLFALGVLGEYIGRIYLESKKRPLYVITEEIDPKESTVSV